MTHSAWDARWQSSPDVFKPRGFIEGADVLLIDLMGCACAAGALAPESAKGRMCGAHLFESAQGCAR